MSRISTLCFIMSVAFWPMLGQESNQAPIYRVTVEQRTVKAVNYGHRTQPTQIDFRGTVLLPHAKGDAKVESRSGAVEVDAKFDGLEPPTRYGPEYLTYVLWAITPNGRPTNLGEVVADGSNNAKLKVTTQMQAFGLIVTAEPYFSVTQPSGVVVLENAVRPDTKGFIEQIDAKYELLPRPPKSTVELQPGATANAGGKKLPQDQYEAVVAMYQAQNALQIARADGADKYAAETLDKAQKLYDQAQTMQNGKTGSKQVITFCTRGGPGGRRRACNRNCPQESAGRSGGASVISRRS